MVHMDKRHRTGSSLSRLQVTSHVWIGDGQHAALFAIQIWTEPMRILPLRLLGLPLLLFITDPGIIDHFDGEGTNVVADSLTLTRWVSESLSLAASAL